MDRLKFTHHLSSTAAVVVAILLWQLASGTIVDASFLPAPTTVAQAFAELLEAGTLQADIAASLKRVFLGWLLGSAIAIPIGLVAGASRIGRALVDPFIHFFRFVPALALVSLFVVWFGIGEMSKVLLIAYACGFLIMVNTATGAAGVASDKQAAARCLGASSFQVFRRVTIPATAPEIFTGMRLSLAVSFLVIVAAEALAADNGIGYLIWNSRIYFRVDWAFVGIIVLGVLGLASDRIWKYLGRSVFRRWLGSTINY